MKIPKTIKIGAFVYKVTQNYEFKERMDLLGQADNGVFEIRLCNRDVNGIMHPDKIKQIFFHELLHCIDYVYNSMKLDEDTNERLSQGLFQVISDNCIL